jgi:hypothetical protein
MKCEFMKDAFHDVWLYYAKDVHVRKQLRPLSLNAEEAKKMHKAGADQKNKNRVQLIEGIEDFKIQADDDDNGAVDRMFGYMEKYYGQLKADAQLVGNVDLDEGDCELEGIMKTLKPNTTAKNFKDFLSQKDNNIRTQAWRKISRRVFAAEDKARRLAELEKNPELRPEEMKVTALVQAFSKNNRTAAEPLTDMPAENRLVDKLVATQQAKRAHELIERKYGGVDGCTYAFDDAAAASVKAELIRRDLLSRKDLMQMYRPPLKKSEVAGNNPFKTRSIVSRSINEASSAYLPIQDQLDRGSALVHGGESNDVIHQNPSAQSLRGARTAGNTSGMQSVKVLDKYGQPA